MPNDRDAIIETVTKVAWYADRRNWDAITGLFTEKVLLDYTSLTGGEPATVSPQQIASDWQHNLGALNATQHLLGSYLVNQAGTRRKPPPTSSPPTSATNHPAAGPGRSAAATTGGFAATAKPGR